MSKIIVIGGGAAGMMAAIQSAACGHNVLLLEQNEKLGKKIYITGKGRCNLTNACDTEDLFKSVLHNGKFLYSAFYSFSNAQVIDFFESHGLATKTERGERVFPASDHASDVIRTLQKVMEDRGVKLRLCTRVQELLVEPENRIAGVRLSDGEILKADAVIAATGGCSYPSTGSTGDGYRFARACGHQVTELRPALVPFEAGESWVTELQGLSLRNVRVRIRKEKKIFYEEFGEMLFTHFGVSGPVILSASSYVADFLEKGELTLCVDLKPALEREQLDKRILRDFEKKKNRQYKNALDELLPSKLIPVVTERSRIPAEKAVHEITREERRQLADVLKDFRLTLTGMRGYGEAIITRGGVSVKEIHPATMESRLVKGLYFAGEVLDLDGVTGGFNLQIAWSTGFLAGRSAGLAESDFQTHA